MRLSWVLPLTVLSVGLGSGDADACSVSSGCHPTRQLQDAGLPQNAVLIVHVGSTIDAGPLLLSEDGGVVPIQVTESLPTFPGDRAMILTPSTPLVSGERYWLRHCMTYLGGAAGWVLFEQPFEVRPAQPVPPTAGTLTVASVGRETIEAYTSGGTCTEPLKAAVARLAITPSAAIAPFVASTSWLLEVDGKTWARERFGGISASGQLETPGTYYPLPLHRADVVYAACEPNTPTQYRDLGIPEGMHTATLRAQVAGQSLGLPVLQVSFMLSCNPDGGAPVVPSDGGPPDSGQPDAGSPDGGPPDSGQPDAGSPDAGQPDAGFIDAGAHDSGQPDAGQLAGTPPPGCGCNGTGGLPAAWAIFALLVARRQRRSITQSNAACSPERR